MKMHHRQSSAAILPHFPGNATMVSASGRRLGLVLPAFHPVVELGEDVTQDRSTALPFVADSFQVPKHAVVALDMIVCADIIRIVRE